jgi:hypothetical protein
MSNDPETVDPVDQLAMSLKWEEDYTDEYKRRVLIDFYVAMHQACERKLGTCAQQAKGAR